MNDKKKDQSKVPPMHEKRNDEECWCGAELVEGHCGELLRQQRERT